MYFCCRHFVVAWIEIFGLRSNLGILTRRHFVVAWIEISVRFPLAAVSPCRHFVVAWIEIQPEKMERQL